MLGERCLRARDRKRRLFAVACGRRVAHLVPNQKCQEAIELIERFADGHLDAAGLTGAIAAVTATVKAARVRECDPFLLRDLVRRSAHWSALNIVTSASEIATYAAAERLAQADLIREIFGNPFRPVAFDPAWHTDTAVSLSRTMYEAREFSAMPILADALQDAGCDHKAILDHCRGPGPHVRGCWVVDLVLGKA
jgi:hypothetical protein